MPRVTEQFIFLNLEKQVERAQWLCLRKERLRNHRNDLELGERRSYQKETEREKKQMI